MYTLYSYWRSSSAWRVRLVLELKDIPYSVYPVHLVKDGGEQHSDWYTKKNPLTQIPTLEFTDTQGNPQLLTQSVAIAEYLEARHPSPSIFTPNTLTNATIRQIVEIINSGIQPLQNLSVLQFIDSLDPSQQAKKNFAKRVIEKGLRAINAIVQTTPNTHFLCAEHPTFADCCLIPQLYNARRFGCSMEGMERLLEVETRLEQLSAFQKAHPDQQVDCPNTQPHI